MMDRKLEILERYLKKPELYEPGTAPFWDDEYISANMLEAHLNPEWDAASRNFAFIDKSVDWIASIAPPAEYQALLDLGCGPGLYAERFAKYGYHVTGMDYSKRSIAYAKEQTAKNNSGIRYIYQNYLTLDETEQFDVVTLIYCDYSVMCREDRETLLAKIRQALKPGGKLIFDVFTEKVRKPDSKTWQYNENGGFYTPEPHLSLESVSHYENELTELTQCIVVTEDSCNCYNIWDHFFTKESLAEEIHSAGFTEIDFYGDVAGASVIDDIICAVVRK